ncbi:hypothetical protein FRC02_008981 [Tulasnella sp. 418]|nr:hypothetical protein FRC02_008981 [Tulasnella sp. 418]
MMSEGYDREDSHHWDSSSPGSSSSHSTSSPRSGSETDSTIPADPFENGGSADSFEIAPNLACWSSKRHLTTGNPSPSQFPTHNLPPWRGKDSKLKTAHAALILCLNIGVDPPDTVKTNPCAVLECWVDPFSLPPSKALDAIGKNLQHQFESLNPRMRYKTYLDPSVEDTRKFCVGLRKTAKDERALFYYNGHGVPRPTPSGEIWVFNKGYTQYIPVSILDLQSWLGSPCIYVWDCSGAGHIIENFNKYAVKRDQEFKNLHPDPQSASNYVPFMDCIQLAACAADETLPMTPELPADLFTSCLTSPIEIALRYFVLQNRPRISVTIDEVMQIPGDLKDRRTPLGELNWIFTAVTDTIAWTTFPRDIFKRLFRQDWTVAALFRNFLLAERIMRNYHCTPRTHPPLPPTHTHSLWASWDLAVDTCLSQLRDLLDTQKRRHQAEAEGKQPEPPHQYIPSTFFAEHLTAFEVWLSRGGSALTKRGPLAPDPALFVSEGDSTSEGYLNGEQVESPTSLEGPGARSSAGALVPRKPPDQLPILLQVLLSQAHRLRALILLSSFVDLGPWAVHLALTIGIFPYVQKLLQSPATDLRPVLIFIWARILAFDPSCQVDLLKDNGYLYFTNLLAPGDLSRLNIPNVMEHLAMCAFILSALARDYRSGQVACIQADMFKSCIFGLESDDFLMRQWSALCIAQMWDGYDEAKRIGVELKLHDKLNSLLLDVSAEVRAAVVYAMGVLLGTSGSADRKQRGGGGMGSLLSKTEWKHMKLELSLGMGIVLTGKEDGSPMVRKEVVIVASALVHEWRGIFVIAAWIYWEQNRKWRTKVASGNASLGIGEMDEDDYLDSGESIAQIVSAWASKAAEGKTDRKKSDYRAILSSFFTILTALFELTVDPYPEVAAHARTAAQLNATHVAHINFVKLGTAA